MGWENIFEAAAHLFAFLLELFCLHLQITDEGGILL